MPQYIKKIRTSSGDLKIDYEALANLPKLGALAPKNKVGKDDLANDALDGYATIDTIVGPHSQELSYNLKSNNEYDVAGIGSCTDTDIIIPSIVDGKRVTGIDSSAFS